jgi:hypothetical protein
VKRTTVEDDLVQLVTELVDELEATGLVVQRRLDPASQLPMGPEPENREQDIRSSLDFIESQIATLEDDAEPSEPDDHALYWAVRIEVDALDLDLRGRLLGWQGLTDTDRTLIRSQRAPALERLRREHDELSAELDALTSSATPTTSAWTVLAEAHRHPEVFTWLLGQVRQRRCGAPGAPGRSIRKRTLGRALQAAVSRHSARMAS